jgi:hypothetical protein
VDGYNEAAQCKADPSLESARKQKLTESELLFEEYLTVHGYADFWRVPEGAEMQPDYGVRHQDAEAMFEVKEFDGDPPPMGFGTFDAYGPIRRKLNKAAKKFRRYKDRPCGAVLSSFSTQMVPLDWQYIAGAMFGDLGFTIPLGEQPSAITPFFGKGGKMQQALNTTVSATIVLRRGVFAGRKMLLEAKQAEVALGRRLFAEECGELLQRLRSEEPPSVLVVENPHAVNPLSRHWFCGPYDERFGLDDRGFGCIFVGADLTALEQQEKK